VGYTVCMLTSKLPLKLYSAAQVRELDHLAIDRHGIAGFTLMQRAAQAAYQLLRQQWPHAQRLLVVCGAGNNGGDGYLLACLAFTDDLQVTVVEAGEQEHGSADAVRARQQWQDCGGRTVSAKDVQVALSSVEVIVDALLGTGLQRELGADWADMVTIINQAQKPVLSIDVPSGLHADTGAVMGVAIEADITMTFIGLKQGLFTGRGPDYCGQIFLDDLDVPADIFTQVKTAKHILDGAELHTLLPPRQPGCHKGQCGHVLVIGGDKGMAGAVRMAAEAAARVGAGLVSVATRPAHVDMVNAGRPELMCHGIEDVADLMPLLNRASVVAIGPGLGQSAWAQAMLAEVMQTQLYLVLDADALNLVAARPHKRGRWIFTPHPGEAARLLGWSSEQVQKDRFKTVNAISEQYNCITVLKGAGSLVQAAQEANVYLCREGNPGMATAGMGDVLTGVIAGLLAQGLSLVDAARSGVFVHAAAADLAARQGQRGLLATDLYPHLRVLVNPPDVS
jgi:NAD(P)H-hydrate epimerase